MIVFYQLLHNTQGDGFNSNNNNNNNNNNNPMLKPPNALMSGMYVHFEAIPYSYYILSSPSYHFRKHQQNRFD
ncbi:unnamed protein product [Schistosoma mattheei]|uniref:Uncharacterized protein n=1 Tax=Schistosoma mattheei TaxID=31246 RepID=A0A183NSM2_9TREM|nr:unnamed protein product [Schistosoma mattheei]